MVQDIAAASDLAPSTVSEHLRLMREAGLLISRRDGPRVWYCLDRSTLEGLSDALLERSRMTSRSHRQGLFESVGPSALA